ncbi:MAG: hypothetical protein AB9903_27945 [Vulcanimicrobiota bacterium]
MNSPLNMVKWILSFGSNARVLEHQSLIEAVKEEAGRIHAIYQ